MTTEEIYLADSNKIHAKSSMSVIDNSKDIREITNSTIGKQSVYTVFLLYI